MDVYGELIDYYKLLKDSINENQLINSIAIELEMQKLDGKVDENLVEVFKYLIKNGIDEFILIKLLAL